jgi:glycosyltransferase involved in cell wall biosynthesis
MHFIHTEKYKISVCMTSFNGEVYIEKQIRSILPQLNEGDELIICDDCSSDTTVDIINSIQDSRIKLHINQKNLGFIRNFDRCIQMATGDIIFISDQDDIWKPNKVEDTISIFEKFECITLVISNLDIIDDRDNLVQEKLVENIKTGTGNKYKRISRNFLKGMTWGCTLAFRRNTLQWFIPFPDDVPSYDVWIGLIHDIYGVTYHIEESLIFHRKHDSNVTSEQRSDILTILWRRYLIAKNVFVRMIELSNNTSKP